MGSLPYVTSYGNISKALDAVKSAAVPERVSQDFVKTILKIPGGSGDQMTSFLKKIGFADSSGKPTEIYMKFRNPSSTGMSMAKAIRSAYAPLFVRNEFMYELSDDELIGLIVEETGQARDSNPVKMTFGSLKALLGYADFTVDTGASHKVGEQTTPRIEPPQTAAPHQSELRDGIALNLGYTINLNLPASTDPAVFNAIFKSLKENLLRDDDG